MWSKNEEVGSARRDGDKVGFHSPNQCQGTLTTKAITKPQLSARSEEAIGLPPLIPISILVIEDSAFQRSFLNKTLSGVIDNEIWVVKCVNTGEEAFTEISSVSKPYDVLFVDQQMPGRIQGNDVVERAREVGKESQIIIGFTAFDEKSDKLFESGVDAVWIKPMAPRCEVYRKLRLLRKIRQQTVLENGDATRTGTVTGTGAAAKTTTAAPAAAPVSVPKKVPMPEEGYDKCLERLMASSRIGSNEKRSRDESESDLRDGGDELMSARFSELEMDIGNGRHREGRGA